MKNVVYAIVAMMFAVAANAGERLNAAQIKEYLKDQTISGESVKHGPVKTYFGADGKVRSVSDDGERKGKWWVDEDFNLRCVKWEHKNKDSCHYVEKNEDGTHTLVHKRSGKRLVEMKTRQAGDHL